MYKLNYRLLIFCFFYPLLIHAQIGIGTPTPHPQSSLHLKDNNKALVLNSISNLDIISDPIEGMLIYDSSEKCIKAFVNSEWSECFGSPKKDPVVSVKGPGFVGDYTRGEALVDATFQVTVSNDTFRDVSLGFHISDLELFVEGITVEAVYLADSNVKNSIQIETNFPAGGAKTIVYKLSGIPQAPYTVINAIWNKVVLSYEHSTPVKYKFECSNGFWAQEISPSLINGFQKDVSYSGQYKLTYDVDATGFVFEAFTQTSNGLTIQSGQVIGQQSGEIVFNLSGVYNTNLYSNALFLPPYGCTISLGFFENCKEIKDVAPYASSGIYLVDVDGSGSLDPLECYCDMETDGGGWTLILNYLHKAGTNPNLNILSDRFPLQNGTILGVDESSTPYWGHISSSFASKLNFNEVRFYGITSNHKRKINFKLGLSNAVSYVKLGRGSFIGIESNSVFLDGHNAVLPSSSTKVYSDKLDYTLTEFPFWQSGGPNWSIKTKNSSGAANRWEVDDFWHTTATQTNSPSTHHQVWVR